MIDPARYTCYRTAGPIVIDGRLDEPAWITAPKSTPFDSHIPEVFPHVHFSNRTTGY